MSPAQGEGGTRVEAAQVAVIGAGHVGLPTAAALATLGHTVRCAESDPDRFKVLRDGGVPIFEEGLAEALEAGRREGRLSFVVRAEEAVQDAEFTFICVPTPECADGSADLSFLRRAALEIGPHLRPGAVVVNKSTVPIGSTRLIEHIIGRDDVSVVSNPEFLREGSALRDSLRPDRIVVGSEDHDTAVRVAGLLASTGAPLLVTDAATAEAIKYVANTFLATKVSFVNAVAGLCDEVGADIGDVVRGIGFDPRIGSDFLRPGPGWGGSCFPKDTQALLHMANTVGFDFPLLRAAITTNDAQPQWIVAKLEKALRDRLGLGRGAAVLENRTLAVWGLTFKAGTDDLRASPALRVVAELLARGAYVSAFDPTVCSHGAGDHLPRPLRREWEALAFPLSHLDRLTLSPSAVEAAAGTAALVVLTEWEEFRNIDMLRLRAKMAEPLVVDARNLLDPETARAAGLAYVGVGRH